MKYGLQLFGYPREEVCDPSNLSTNELFTLRDSLQTGTCSFEHLPDADKDALKAVVDEQEKRGENPWRKRKRRSDFGKSKKTRKISDPTVPLGSTSVHTHPAQHDLNSDNEHLVDDDGIGLDDGFGLDNGPPQNVIHKRSVNAARTEMSELLQAYDSEDLDVVPGALSGCGSADYDSDSGEDKLDAAGNDPMHYLSRCICRLEDIEGTTRDG